MQLRRIDQKHSESKEVFYCEYERKYDEDSSLQIRKNKKTGTLYLSYRFQLQSDEFMETIKSDFYKFNQVRTHYTAAVSGLSIRELYDKKIIECIYNHRLESYVSLRNLLEVKDKPSEATRLMMIEQLLKAVNAVHEMDIVHGNINIDNIFWNNRNKIVLGLPRYRVIQQQQQMNRDNVIICPKSKYLHEMAPQLEQKKYSFFSDIWAIGVVILQVTYKFELSTHEAFADIRGYVEYNQDHLMTPTLTKDLLLRIFVSEPEKRIGIIKIFSYIKRMQRQFKKEEAQSKKDEPLFCLQIFDNNQKHKSQSQRVQYLGASNKNWILPLRYEISGFQIVVSFLDKYQEIFIQSTFIGNREYNGNKRIKIGSSFMNSLKKRQIVQKTGLSVFNFFKLFVQKHIQMIIKPQGMLHLLKPREKQSQFERERNKISIVKSSLSTVSSHNLSNSDISMSSI